jgi:hypothetical protein
MKKAMWLHISLIFFTVSSNAQSGYLSDIILTNDDIEHGKGYTTIPFNYWRYDTCLYNKKSICKYNQSTAAQVKVYQNSGTVIYEFLRGNNSGYQSKNPYDTLRYFFVQDNMNASRLVRELLIKEKYVKTDTFNLTVVDTLLFNNYSVIKKVFGKAAAEKQQSLKIYVLKSVDGTGSVMLHYWTERIGIIKLTDEKCWRYSFEMKGNRTRSIQKMFTQLIQVIHSKYKDPYWLSQPCSVE